MSKNRLRQNAATKAKSSALCQISIRRIVILAVASIAFIGKKPDPSHQSDKRAGKSEQGKDDQEPWRGVEIPVEKISENQTGENSAGQLERDSQI